VASTGQPIVARRGEGVLWRRVGDEAVLLDPESGRAVSLNRAATCLWEALEEPAGLDELAGVLVEHWHLAPGQARADANAFLESLSSRGLVTLTPADE
jgi:PqqD family protein of HPr-rel-A system